MVSILFFDGVTVKTGNRLFRAIGSLPLFLLCLCFFTCNTISLILSPFPKKTKQNKTKQNETKRNETKRNETKQNKTKQKNLRNTGTGKGPSLIDKSSALV